MENIYFLTCCSWKNKFLHFYEDITSLPFSPIKMSF